MELFCPGLQTDPSAYRGRCFLAVRGEQGLEWRKADENADAAELVRSHLLGGAGVLEDEHQGDELVHVGVTVPEGQLVRAACLDLDGNGYDAREVCAAWRRRFGKRRGMLTLGSGAPGRFRLWFRLAEPVPIEKLEPALHRLLVELGFPPQAGGVEVFPSPKRNGRLPFGFGACKRLSLVNMGELETAHPFELVRRFKATRAINLRGYVRGAPRRRAVRHSGDVERRKGEASMPAQFRALWREGASVGQRRHVLRELVACWHKMGKARDTVIGILRDNAPRLFRNTRAWWNGRTRAAFVLVEIPRLVNWYFNKYKQALPDPENLTRRDVVRLVEHCRRQEEATGVPARALFLFSRRALRVYRGAWLKGFHPHPEGRIDTSRTKVRLHRNTWESWAEGTGYRYAELRAACGLFVDAGEGYRAEKWCFRPGDARCKAWICSFRFQGRRSPARSLLGLRRDGLAWLTAQRVKPKRGGASSSGGSAPSSERARLAPGGGRSTVSRAGMSELSRRQHERSERVGHTRPRGDRGAEPPVPTGHRAATHPRPETVERPPPGASLARSELGAEPPDELAPPRNCYPPGNNAPEVRLDVSETGRPECPK